MENIKTSKKYELFGKKGNGETIELENGKTFCFWEIQDGETICLA